MIINNNVHDTNNFKDILLNNIGYKDLSYKEILAETRKYVVDQNSSIASETNQTEENKELVRSIIEHFVSLQGFLLPNKTTEQLVKDLYNDMVGFSFLEKWIYKDNVEEVNINAWNDIEVVMSGKKPIKIDEFFTSPEHAFDIVRRMLATHNITIDDSKPAVTGYLSDGVRICCFKSPIVADNVGVSASIRIVKPNTVSLESLLSYESARSDELNLLAMLINHRVSVCASGDTGSGKTTTLSWLLTQIPDEIRTLVMEEGSREFILTKIDPETGRPKNSVVSLLTRESDNPEQRISLQDLNEYAMRMNPRIIAVGEMRSAEAYEVSEVARTGHTVVSTIHSMSAVSTYKKMMTLAYKKYQMDTNFMLDLMVEAFPIVFYQKQFEDGSRKIVEIIEGESTESGKVKYRTLYKFVTTNNVIDKSGKIIKVEGHHIKTNNISKKLQNSLIENGLPREKLNEYLKIPIEKENPNVMEKVA